MTADECIARARLIYPAIPLSTASSPDGLDLLNELMGELLFDVPLLSEEVSVSLTDGTPNYDLTTPLRVWSARYVRSATTGDFKTLKESSQDEQDYRSLDHLRFADSEPDEYWVLEKSTGQKQLWLSPTPPTTTSGSYPKVVLRVTKYTALANSSELPIGLPSYEAFVLGLALKWGSYIGDPKVDDLEKRFLRRKLQLSTFHHSVVPSVNPSLRPNFKWRTRKV